MAHLNVLHGAGVSSGSELNFKDLILGKLHTHFWSGVWEALPRPSSHIGRMTLTMSNFVLGLKLKLFDIKSVAEQVRQFVNKDACNRQKITDVSYSYIA